MTAAGAAFAVGAGFVLGEFVRAVRPVGFLTRPLLAVAVLAIGVGLVSSVFGRWSVVAAVSGMAWIVQPHSGIAVGTAVAVAGLIGWRLWKGSTLNVDLPVAAAAGVFFAAGLIPIVPLVSWSTPARASEPSDGPARYVVLLDGYPRADTLADIGYPIDGFLSALEDRGFTYHPDASTDHPYTFQALTDLTGGDPDAWVEGDIANNRQIRADWRLPDGWAAISPPMGFVTIPHARTLNGGITFFESKLIGRSVIRELARGWVADAYRTRLDTSLETLATTAETRIFAHIFAPHLPALYDAHGPRDLLDCWPYCAVIDPRPPGVEPEELASMVGGYVYWLNDRLIDVVDSILDRRPDAEIVLFSDHGGRWDDGDKAEWRRTFLATRSVDAVEPPFGS